MKDTWSLPELKSWARSLLESYRVIAPVAGPEGAEWAEVKAVDAIAWDYGRSALSPRSWLLPRSEPLLRYDMAQDPPVLEESPVDARPTILLLLRPCDVAGLRAIDDVMRWDFTDEPFEARRAATILVSMGCNEAPSPDACFCTAVGVDPRFAPAADVAIERLDHPDAPEFRFFPQTEAGRKILTGAPGPAAEGRPEPRNVETVAVDVDGARAWMKEHFDDPFWDEAAVSCLGCGACAFVCPSCHCFDVVDEGDWRRGERVRNWDSCQFSHFTVHATGHNPRPKQSLRYRQRIYHKFQYYPDKFGRLLCTGCGRCVEACPGGMDLIEVLQDCAAREGVRS